MGHFPSKKECPNTQFEGIKKRKGNGCIGITGAIEIFSGSKMIVGPDENIENSLKVLQLPRETSATADQCRNIIAQISITPSTVKVSFLL